MSMTIAWEHDMERAKARALRERKPLMIDVIKDP